MKLFYYCTPAGLKILENLEVKISSPNQLNDPFEFLPYPDADVPTLEDFNKCSAFQRAGHGFCYCLSMSKNSENPRMWAQYAANHTGLMIEFDMDQEPFLALVKEKSALVPVNYDHPKRVPLSTYASPADLEKMFRDLMERKGAYWREEEEVRLLFISEWFDGKKIAVREFSAEEKIITLLKLTEKSIASVTLGLRSSDVLVDSVRHLLRTKFSKTLLYQAKMLEDGFVMVREEIGVARRAGV